MKNNTAEKLEDTPIVSILPGGLDGDGNWLDKLDIGDTFLVKPKSVPGHKVYALQMWAIQDRTRRATLLANPISREIGHVDPRVFSQSFDLWEVLEKKEKKDEVHVEDYRPD